MAAIVEGGGVPLIIGIMETHRLNVDLMDSGTCCLSNLCYNNMENKVMPYTIWYCQCTVHMEISAYPSQ